MARKKDYLERLPEKLKLPGSTRDGEIQLRPLSDNEDIREGIVYEDDYVILVRDPVTFPNGREGHYLRLIERSSLENGVSGTVMVPATSSHIFFIRVFRHATRTWEWELPRGFQEPGLTPLQNAEKEIVEEIGIQPLTVVELGKIKPNTGMLSSEVFSFAATLPENADGLVAPQTSEAIEMVRPVPFSELSQFLREHVTCGFSLSAILQAHLVGFIRF